MILNEITHHGAQKSDFFCKFSHGITIKSRFLIEITHHGGEKSVFCKFLSTESVDNHDF